MKIFFFEYESDEKWGDFFDVENIELIYVLMKE